MSLKPVIRISMVILGVVLVVGAFAAVLTLGIGTNPPPLRIAVIQHDVIIGEHLKQGDFRIVEQIIDPRLAALYVQEHELSRYLGAFVIDPLRRGDPISKVKLAVGDGEIALRRYSLVLTDANEVIMTLPVNPDVIPARISPGDFVNILFAGGAETGLQQLPPDATPSAPPPLDAMLIPTPTHFIEFSLPMADVMLEHVPILDINYQATQGSRFGNGTAANDVAVGNGPISSIVVKVPRSHQSLLMFGATVSKLRFAISSPIFNASKSAPELGMDWSSYVNLYRWKQAQVLTRGETLTHTLYPAYTAQPR